MTAESRENRVITLEDRVLRYPFVTFLRLEDQIR